jgi:hypothetical protein
MHISGKYGDQIDMNRFLSLFESCMGSTLKTVVHGLVATHDWVPQYVRTVHTVHNISTNAQIISQGDVVRGWYGGLGAWQVPRHNHVYNNLIS